MENKNIAIIESTATSLSKQFGFTKFEYNNKLKSEEDIDQSIEDFFNNKENETIEKIIIPMKLGTNDIDDLGLKFGLHIRLTKELKGKRYIPIIFISARTKEDILARQIKNAKDLTATILFTQGTTITKGFDLVNFTNDYNQKLDEYSYQSEFLRKIILKNQREEGHQLANEWGIFRLAKFAGLKKEDIIDDKIKLPKDLFFKYYDVKSKQSLEIVENETVRRRKIEKSPKFVLIDDQADKGWNKVLRHILKTNITFNNEEKKGFNDIKDNDITIIQSFEVAKNFLKKDGYYENMDIVFLDLRLRPEEDKKNDTPEKIKELSGMKILRKIKKINQGIQVIILTASNKSWNMKKMLDAGADGYFVKESPEIPLSDELSKANYDSLIENIKNCLEKSYLREIYKGKKELVERLDGLESNNKYDANFLEEIKKQLEIACFLLLGSNSNEKFAYAFVSLYLVIEIINNEFVKKEDSDNKWKIGTQINLLDWKWDNSNRRYSNSNTQLTGEKPPEWVKFTGVFFQKWEQSEQRFVKNIYYQIQMRNHFIHSDEGLNTDIYDPKKGFQALFENIKKIIGFLSTSI